MAPTKVNRTHVGKSWHGPLKNTIPYKYPGKLEPGKKVKKTQGHNGKKTSKPVVCKVKITCCIKSFSVFGRILEVNLRISE